MSADIAGSPASSTWAAGVRRVSDEAAGVITVQVVQLQDVPEMLWHALAGDPEATRLTNMVSGALREIQAAPRRRPMLCAACPRALRGGRYAIVCAIPARDDPREALALAVCRRCGTDHATITAKAAVALTRIWPDLRLIAAHPGEGHA